MAKREKKPHNRDFVWGSYKGPIKIKDMDDNHLLNVTHMTLGRIESAKKLHKEFLELTLNDPEIGFWKVAYWKTRVNKLNATKRILFAEMSFRNLDKKLLKKAPYPFIDDQGNERVWDYENNTFTIKPPSLRFITED